MPKHRTQPNKSDALVVEIRDGGAMAALEIRKDRTPTVLRREAKGAGDARVARRILAIANAIDGISREEAARSAGRDRQTLRDWVIRYNEHGLDGLSDRWSDGRPQRLTADEQAELLEISCSRAPIPRSLTEIPH